MAATKIEWADRVWNPITGCTKCSPACDNCYAERVATTRLAGRFGYPAKEPFRVTLHEDKLREPTGWKKPARIFACSMGDLFHPDVPFAFVDKMLTVVGLTRRHTHLWLTKRPERMAEYFSRFKTQEDWADALADVASWMGGEEAECALANAINEQLHEPFNVGWPMRNLWLGTTIWDQASADRAVPILLSTPAAKRFVSVEPMLGPVNLTAINMENEGYYSGLYINSLITSTGNYGETYGQVPDWYGLDWVICGGETGPGARPMHPDWPRSLRDKCQAAGVPFFFKQWGEWGDMPWRVFAEKCVAITPEGETYSPDAAAFNGEALPVDAVLRCRVGKKRAGRVLDGRTWEEVPA